MEAPGLSTLVPALSSGWAGQPVRSPGQVGKELWSPVGHPEVPSPVSLCLMAKDGPRARLFPTNVEVGRTQ